MTKRERPSDLAVKDEPNLQKVKTSKDGLFQKVYAYVEEEMKGYVGV